MAAPPRERMIDAAGRLLRSRGLAATSVRDVVDLAGAPWGSVRHYFPGGKEQLVVEALQRGHQLTTEAIRACFAATPDPAAAMAMFFDGGIAVLEESAFVIGCPVATVAAETAGDGTAIAGACRAALDDWQAELERGFVAMAVGPERAATLAAVVLQHYEGAILLARVRQSVAPMELASSTVRELLAGT